MAAKYFAFQANSDGTELTIEQAVYQAIGAASVCWESMAGTGVFQDDQARDIAVSLLSLIEDRTARTLHDKGAIY